MKITKKIGFLFVFFFSLFASFTILNANAKANAEENSVCLNNECLEYGDSLYYSSKNIKKTWNDAKDDCIDKGGKLTGVEDSNEYLFLKDNFLSQEYGNIWLGGFSEANSDVWKWTGTNQIINMKFLYGLKEGEPNNDIANKNGLAMFSSDGKIQDVIAIESYSYVCKINKPNLSNLNEDFSNDMMFYIENIYKSRGIDIKGLSLAFFDEDLEKLETNLTNYTLTFSIVFQDSEILGLINTFSNDGLLLPNKRKDLLNKNKQYTLKITTLYDKNKTTPVPKKIEVVLLNEENEKVFFYKNLSESDSLLSFNLLGGFGMVLGKNAKILESKVYYTEKAISENPGYIKFYNIPVNNWYKSDGLCGKNKTPCKRSYMLKWYGLSKNEGGQEKLKGIQAVVYFDGNNDGIIQEKEIVSSFFYPISEEIVATKIKFPTSSSILKLEDLTKTSFKINIETELRERVENFLNNIPLFHIKEEKKEEENINYCPANPIFVIKGKIISLPKIENGENIILKLDNVVVNHKIYSQVANVTCENGQYNSKIKRTFTETCEKGYVLKDGKCKEIEINKTFEFTGKIEEYIVQKDGIYELQVWGAQGGGWDRGGKGGYAKGEVILKKGTKLYISVGQYGENGRFGGGGEGTEGKHGGGGTDIRLSPNDLNTRFIVAGGGGGATSYDSANGGYGGGTSGGSGLGNYGNPGTGGNDRNGGGGGYSGSFGFGGNGRYKNNGHGGAGGGGWFGGGGAYPDSSRNDDKGGGGGSGYVLTNNSYKPSGYNVSSQYYLSNTILKSGNDAIPNKTNTSTQIGNTGDGQVKITKMFNDEEENNNNIECYFPSKDIITHFGFDDENIKNYATANETTNIYKNLSFDDSNVIGKTAIFNGNNSYIKLGTNYNGKLHANFSVSFWLNPENTNINGTILVAQDSRHLPTFGLYNTDNGTKLKLVKIENTTTEDLTEIGKIDIKPGKFNLYTITVDNSIIKVYVNGLLKETFNNQINLDGINTTIGAEFEDNTTLKNFYKGKIDEFLLYEKVLTDKEIAILYNNGKGLERCGIVCKEVKKEKLFPYNGLLAYYTFDIDGKVGMDSNHMYNGTTTNIENSSGFGKIGKGIKFKDKTSRFTLDREISFLDRSFSTSIWVKVDKHDSSKGLSCLFSHKASNYSKNRTIHFCFKKNGVFTNDYYGDGIDYPEFNIKNHLNEWLHIVTVNENYGSNKKTKLYVNGKLIKEANHSGIFNGGIDNIGGEFKGGALFASVDEVGIWDKSLTEEEVAILYNKGSGITYPGLEITCGEKNGHPYTDDNDCKGYSGVGYSLENKAVQANWEAGKAFCENRGGIMVRPKYNNFRAIKNIFDDENLDKRVLLNIKNIDSGNGVKFILGNNGFYFNDNKSEWKWNTSEPNELTTEKWAEIRNQKDGGYVKINNINNIVTDKYVICEYENAKSSLVNGLSAYFDFDEGNYKDYISGIKQEYVETNAQSFDEGKIGKGLKIKNNQGVFQIFEYYPTNMSVSLWYKKDGLGNTHNTLLSYGDIYNHLMIKKNNSKITSYNHGWTSYGRTINDGEWNHFVLIKKGTQYSIYVNGKKDTSGTSFNNTDRPLQFIGNQKISGGKGALGILDEIGFWDRELTEDEIQELYNDGLGIPNPKKIISTKNQENQTEKICKPEGYFNETKSNIEYEENNVIFDFSKGDSLRNWDIKNLRGDAGFVADNHTQTGSGTDWRIYLSKQKIDNSEAKKLSNINFRGEFWFNNNLNICWGANLGLYDSSHSGKTSPTGTFGIKIEGPGDSTIPRASREAGIMTPGNINELVQNLRKGNVKLLDSNLSWQNNLLIFKVRDNTGKWNFYVNRLPFICNNWCTVDLNIKNKKGTATVIDKSNPSNTKTMNIDFSDIELADRASDQEFILETHKTCGAQTQMKVDYIDYLYK